MRFKKAITGFLALCMTGLTVPVTSSAESDLISDPATILEIPEQDPAPLQVKLRTDSNIVRSGSDLKIYVDIKGDIPDDAWLAYVPSDVPHTEKDSDEFNGNWVYLKDIKNGEVILKAPKAVGNYDIRVFDADKSDDAKEIAYLPIILEYAPDLEVSIDVDSRTVKAIAPLDIKVDIKGYVPDDAWITFVPTDVPHTEKDGDEHNGNWKALKDIENGIATINTPATVGAYDIRVYNGEIPELASEIACKTIYLSKAPDLSVVVSTDNTQVKPSEEMEIKVNITGTIPDDAWITFVPSDIPHTEKDGDDHYGSWARLKDIEGGSVALKAPSETGNYDIRVYNGEDSVAEEIACLPVLVTENPAIVKGATKGDLNSDGTFNVSDAVLLQKWLLSDHKTSLKSWKNGDFVEDNVLDIFDLCLMKKALIKKTSASYVEPDERFEWGVPFYVVKDGLKLYSGPDESYDVIASIPADTRLTESGAMNGNSTWLFTEYNGQCGWIDTLDKDGKMVIHFEEATEKPVIYLYPEKETDVHVELELTESELNTTYPKYNNGWDVTAYPDGTLLNKVDGTHHKYLFWDAVNCRTRFDFSKGFCVAGSDTEAFLKEKLTYMGLTEQEMNEFIVYWLPLMEHNAYNLISFQDEAYTNSAKLTITPTPDSECRIFMAYVPLENAVDIEPQQLSAFERKGFSVVEWGGAEVRSRQ